MLDIPHNSQEDMEDDGVEGMECTPAKLLLLRGLCRDTEPGRTLRGGGG